MLRLPPFSRCAPLGAALLCLLPLQAVRAETLQDALVSAYETSPVLASERAQLRATTENISIAKARGRPSVGVSAEVEQRYLGLTNYDRDGRNLSVVGSFTLPIFEGGRVRNAIAAARQETEVGVQELRRIESQLMLDTVTAYMNVLRDQSVVELNKNQVTVLERQLQASRDRFEVGDVTRTDVAQSEARLEQARSELINAQANLVASKQNYERVVGRAPGTLASPPPLPPLPGTVDQVVDLALADNPAMLGARAFERAARAQVAAAKSEGMPSISAQATGGYQDNLGTSYTPTGTDALRDNNGYSAVGVRVNVPLYQSGGVSARIRQAQANRSSAIEQISATERATTEAARNAWEEWQAAQATIRSAQTAVAANELAAEGTRQENIVGTRNILDVLNAEQELLNTRVLLVRARRNAYVAGFAILALTGRGEARDLELPVNYYDPDVYARKATGRLIGTHIDAPLRPAPKERAPATSEAPQP